MPICASCGEDNPDRARFCMACTAPLMQAPPPEARRTVTVVFSDLAGSTALGERLDSEALREVMGKYFEALRAPLESYGGVVEKFIGDAVMAVFGIPRANEDDALRACRAALGMREALGKLNDELERTYGVRLTNRTGIHTGEVVAGDPAAGQRLVTGDAVNTAARLEQAAPGGEILIGEPTWRLVRGAVMAEPVESVAAKGKAEPVPAWRLAAVTGREAIARHMETPLIGRHQELGLLEGRLERAIETSGCSLVTVVGSPGVGKSRLIAEFLGGLRGRATVLRGRCLPYGDGITFWPLAEVVREAAAIGEADSPERARERLSSLLSGHDEGSAIEARLAAAIGLDTQSFPLEETYWAARKAFEHLAINLPLVVLVEDIHWAEEAFLDLIEHVADMSRDAAIALVCSARPELLEDRPAWSEGREADTVISLEPLDAVESGELLKALLAEAALDEPVHSRILGAAEGNPLFIEQIVSMWIDDGALERHDGRWMLASGATNLSIPPNISALLASRLDKLLGAERTVIERASVVGQVFSRAPVEELAPEALRPQVGVTLLGLMRRQLIGREPPSPAEEDAYRFLHALIRDAAYGGILKRSRAELHERFADWLEAAAGDRIAEYEEILGHHLEQAFRYLAELGPVDERGRALARRAAERLGTAGRRALRRDDAAAAENLLSRAVELLPGVDTLRMDFALELSRTLFLGGDRKRADELAARVAVDAAGALDSLREALARLELVRSRVDREGSPPAAVDEVRELRRVFETLDDSEGLARAEFLLGWMATFRGRFAEAEEHLRAITQHVSRDRRLEGVVTDPRAEAAFCYVEGSTPVETALARCQVILSQVGARKRSVAWVLVQVALLQSMSGHYREARDAMARAEELYDALGRMPGQRMALAEASSRIELRAGDLEAAEEAARTGMRISAEIGDELPYGPVLLAETLLERGRTGEAREVVQGLAPESDVVGGALLRRVQALAASQSGDQGAGMRWARQAVELAGMTDSLSLQGDCLLALGIVLTNANERREAALAVEQALQRYETKGDLVGAERARARLAQLV